MHLRRSDPVKKPPKLPKAKATAARGTVASTSTSKVALDTLQKVRAKKTACAHVVAPAQSAELDDALARWAITFGRAPAFGARAADGSKVQSIDARSALPIDVAMSDVLRMKLPPVGQDGCVDALIRALGVTGPLADEVRRIATSTMRIQGGAIVRLSEHPDAQALKGRVFAFAPGMRVQKNMDLFLSTDAPRGVLAKYIVAELLAGAAQKSGHVAVKQLAVDDDTAADLTRLATTLATIKRGPRVKQLEDCPFDARFLDRSMFPRLRQAVIDTTNRALDSIRMPLVDDIDKRTALDPKLDDNGYGAWISLRQHMLATNVALSRRLGKRCLLIGKNYSTAAGLTLSETGRAPWNAHLDDMHMVVAEKSDVLPKPRPGMPSSNLSDHNVDDKVLDRLRQAGALGAQQVQIIDEGADALLALNELAKRADPPAHENRQPNGMPFMNDIPEWYGHGTFQAFVASLSGVEGTRDGARKLAEVDLAIPVVNVAESILKLLLVGPFIGWSVVEEVKRCIDDLTAQGLDAPKRILVGGYGSVGRSTALLLRELGYEVVIKESLDAHTDEPSKNALRAMQELGVAAVLFEVPQDGGGIGAVVGCVGLPFISDDEMKRLPRGCLLFSASSSTKEFQFDAQAGWRIEDLDRLRQHDASATFAGQDIVVGVPGVDQTHWHVPVRANGGDTELLLMNFGYPVNLTGGLDPIEPVVVQLIRALLLLGSRQARTLPPGSKGLIDLDPIAQRDLLTQLVAQIASLDPPLPQVVQGLVDAAVDEARTALAAAICQQALQSAS